MHSELETNFPCLRYTVEPKHQIPLADGILTRMGFRKVDGSIATPNCTVFSLTYLIRLLNACFFSYQLFIPLMCMVLGF
jgi:hypothetical protein